MWIKNNLVRVKVRVRVCIRDRVRVRVRDRIIRRPSCSKTIYREEEELYLATDTRPELRAQSRRRDGGSTKGGRKK